MLFVILKSKLLIPLDLSKGVKLLDELCANDVFVYEFWLKADDSSESSSWSVAVLLGAAESNWFKFILILVLLSSSLVDVTSEMLSFLTYSGFNIIQILSGLWSTGISSKVPHKDGSMLLFDKLECQERLGQGFGC